MPIKYMSEEKDIKIPAKFKDLIETIEKMSVLDLAELVKILEEKFGVSAMPQMVAAVPNAGANETSSSAASSEKTSFNVELKAAGDQKVQVIKVIKEILGLGLKEAKDFVDAAPKMIKENIQKAEAEEIKKKLEEVGATVEIK